MTMHKGDEETKQVHPLFGLRPWGRHSLVLAVAGVMYIAIGVAYYFVVPGGPRWEALTVARNIAPLSFWALMWWIIGLATLLSSRWPPTADKWGYTVLTGYSAGWGSVYALGVIFEDTPRSNWAGALVFFLVSFMWWAISGLNNPTKVVIVVGEVLDDGTRHG